MAPSGGHCAELASSDPEAQRLAGAWGWRVLLLPRGQGGGGHSWGWCGCPASVVPSTWPQLPVRSFLGLSLVWAWGSSAAPVHKLVASPLPQGSEDSEDDGDDMDALVAAADAQGKPEAGGAFSSDDDAESCPICLNAFRDQAVGTPENCAHYFCLDCILEWSKVSGLGFCLPPGLVLSSTAGGRALARVPLGLCFVHALGSWSSLRLTVGRGAPRRALERGVVGPASLGAWLQKSSVTAGRAHGQRRPRCPCAEGRLADAGEPESCDRQSWGRAGGSPDGAAFHLVEGVPSLLPRPSDQCRSPLLRTCGPAFSSSLLLLHLHDTGLGQVAGVQHPGPAPAPKADRSSTAADTQPAPLLSQPQSRPFSGVLSRGLDFSPVQPA